MSSRTNSWTKPLKDGEVVQLYFGRTFHLEEGPDQAAYLVELTHQKGALSIRVASQELNVQDLAVRTFQQFQLAILPMSSGVSETLSNHDLTRTAVCRFADTPTRIHRKGVAALTFVAPPAGAPEPLYIVRWTSGKESRSTDESLEDLGSAAAAEA